MEVYLLWFLGLFICISGIYCSIHIFLVCEHSKQIKSDNAWFLDQARQWALNNMSPTLASI